MCTALQRLLIISWWAALGVLEFGLVWSGVWMGHPLPGWAVFQTMLYQGMMFDCADENGMQGILKSVQHFDPYFAA